MDYHLMYNDLMDKTNAIFADSDNVRNRIHKMIGYSPMQIIEKADEREMLVREINKKFRVVCGFFRDFIERNYVSRIKPFRSYSGLLQSVRMWVKPRCIRAILMTIIGKILLGALMLFLAGIL